MAGYTAASQEDAADNLAAASASSKYSSRVQGDSYFGQRPREGDCRLILGPDEKFTRWVPAVCV